MKKKLKTTEIYYDEGSATAYIHTYQTSLKNRLVAFARDYPEVCVITEIEDSGKLSNGKPAETGDLTTQQQRLDECNARPAIYLQHLIGFQVGI